MAPSAKSFSRGCEAVHGVFISARNSVGDVIHSIFEIVGNRCPNLWVGEQESQFGSETSPIFG
jgi:hypothetical protein